jgi:hypothetical protein
MAKKVERRKHPRRQVTWPVNVFTAHGTIEGETKDISPNGVFIACEEPLALNENYRIGIIPPNHQIIDVTGKVIWSDLYGIDENNTAFGMGVCFVEIPDKDQNFLGNVVTTHP